MDTNYSGQEKHSLSRTAGNISETKLKAFNSILLSHMYIVWKPISIGYVFVILTVASAVTLIALWFLASRCSMWVIWAHNAGRLPVIMRIFRWENRHLHVFTSIITLTGTRLQLVNKITCVTLSGGECICLWQWHITRKVCSIEKQSDQLYSKLQFHMIQIGFYWKGADTQHQLLCEDKPVEYYF